MTSEEMTPMELVKVEKFDNGCVVGLSVEVSKFGLVFFSLVLCCQLLISFMFEDWEFLVDIPILSLAVAKCDRLTRCRVIPFTRFVT